MVQHMGHLHTMCAHHIRVKGRWREDTELGIERASEGGREGRVHRYWSMCSVTGLLLVQSRGILRWLTSRNGGRAACVCA